MTRKQLAVRIALIFFALGMFAGILAVKYFHPEQWNYTTEERQ